MCADSEGPAATFAGQGASSAGISAAFGGRLVDVEGDGAARGAIHGEALRSLIADGFERWRQHIGERTGRDPDGYIADFLSATDFVRTVTTVSADLYAEVIAIARASNQPAGHVLAYNFMDEEWRYGRDVAGGCSVIGARVGPEDTVILAQNMDLPLSMDGSQALLRIAAGGDRPEQLVPTAAGMIGLFGVNAAGVACCVNTLSALPSRRAGLPVAFVIRQVLTYRDATSAAGFLASVPHASGQHYAIADRGGLRGYECSAERCAAGPADGTLLHTNHPLWWAGDAASPGRAGAAAARARARADASASAGVGAGAGAGTSHARLRALEAGLAEVRSAGAAAPLLSSTSNGLCVRPTAERESATFCSAEFVLTAPPVVRVALGRPNAVEWRPVSWIGGQMYDPLSLQDD
jgi:isopenicillin-N N-acyltransferase like protein